MKKILSNPIVFFLGNLFIYIFYGLLIGISLIPSVSIVLFTLPNVVMSRNFGQAVILLALSAGVAFYLFFMFGTLVFAVFERLLSRFFKEGEYKTDNHIFILWLVYSGIHTLALGLILPFTLGSAFTRMYFKIAGCKIGKNVFINTVGLHDSYLLEIGDNVVIGGRTDVTCHIFEGDKLTLKKIKIGNNVNVGANCYLMPGVEISDNCDIGANSLIRKNRKIEEKSVLMPIPSLPMKETARIMNLGKRRD